jgi:hypothetical protein
MINRRSLIGGLLAAPAIVRLSSLMALPRLSLPPLLARNGHLICNGALLRVDAYPELFSVVGNAYGGTPGLSFRLPDLPPSVLSLPGAQPMRYVINPSSGRFGPAGMLNLLAWS